MEDESGRQADEQWAFKLGGKVAPAPAPAPPKKRNDLRTAAVAGTTVTLGRVWDAANQRPGATEDTVAQNAVSPQHLRVPRGTTVSFVNPADNAGAHAAVSFFEHEFDSGVLIPGRSFTHTFVVLRARWAGWTAGSAPCCAAPARSPPRRGPGFRRIC
ncbi:hypothetical protein [Nonomuraea sp. NPDC050643]|uniref:cupredoxin domain-containing protein n=1 Tax=Nonomuraea sp. NPDC050643 TaxID=3155660 RepID=UPI0033D0AFD0